ncbi:aarF domain-containing kinase [Strigomonas culicis]|uniref:AarF domain-containing kinase n=1 Tax=Strigomonas culicis TaxID=28005 RepID=S9USI8_9TRYP|nr:aarF domain-containing kinase [Strigomonas culicis]EPY33917.1 aarF domain-containing kinase [Strigomonas culicis]|eukprot:EPY25851.1 aarF domain-containing kinase [Strigomonas culicis]
MFRSSLVKHSTACNLANGMQKIVAAMLPTSLGSSLFPSTFSTDYEASPSGAAPGTTAEATTTASASLIDVRQAEPLPAAVAQELQQRHNPTVKHDLRYRAVPANRVSRAAGFASLFMQLGWERVTGGTPEGSVLSSAGHQKIVDTLCRMRGAVLKLGQMLSIQDANTIPPHVTALFERVRDGAFAMPTAQLGQVLATEWRERHWRTHFFARFEEMPMAAASIGQVHYARLLPAFSPRTADAAQGAEVAIKVQYPGVARSIDSDVANLKLLMSLNILPPGMFVDSILKELRNELSMECQYTIEAKKQQRYAALVAAAPELREVFHVPYVVDALTTDQVLVTELVRGVPIDKVATAPNIPQSFRNTVAEKMMLLTLRELFTWNFMQTDPNYANFLFDAQHNRINLLDFGAAREYPKDFVADYLEVVAAAARGDRETIVQKSITLGFLTGREGKEMLDAHVGSVLLLGKPFRDRAAPFDFSAENLPQQIQQHVPTMVRLRLRPPPTPVYSLHRRLSGTILLATKMQAVIPSGESFWRIYDEEMARKAKKP